MAKTSLEPVIFEHERDTKKKRVYKETTEPEVVGAIYLSKNKAAEIGNPDKIAVEIKAA